MHLDVHLGEFVRLHGAWVYALLFVIVFCETGLVVTPFLPGDSLLFVAVTPVFGIEQKKNLRGSSPTLFRRSGALDISWRAQSSKRI